ncbi:hypothetical protein PGH12_01675 [Chryseobacterium wangxinyae]|nr:hypothetical protein [Chryseobacterium sp. CY350]MCY0979238.1 hypothetical protein [Chryseobacterium sp. CY350]WBZ95870.1 hypothetical protein PGH12_01675 [Chryseobacterium sp. CY350]
MRAFFIAFPIWNAVRTELSWTHYRIISRIEQAEHRILSYQLFFNFLHERSTIDIVITFLLSGMFHIVVKGLGYDRSRNDVEYRFNDYITALKQTKDDVEIIFASGSSETFDLVI